MYTQCEAERYGLFNVIRGGKKYAKGADECLSTSHINQWIFGSCYQMKLSHREKRCLTLKIRG